MERLFNRIMLKIVRLLMQKKSARTSFYHILNFLFICIWFLILRKPSRNNKEKWKTAFMQKLFPLHLYLLVTLDHENNMSLCNSSVDLRFYSGGYLWRDRLIIFYVLGWLTWLRLRFMRKTEILIYLHLIFEILLFEICSLMNWISFPV